MTYSEDKNLEEYMTIDTLYLIHIHSNELELIRHLLFDRRKEVPNIWRQLANKSEEMYLNYFQNGFMTGAIYSIRDKVPECWKQLINNMKEIGKNVKIIENH